MKKKFALGAIFFSIYLVFVIALTPANFAFNFVNLPKTMSVHGVKGTIWQMSIDELVHPEVTLVDIEADLSVWSLVMMDPKVALKFGDPFARGPSGTLTASGFLADITIDNADILLSANTIAQRMPSPIPLEASGDVNITLDKFVIGKPICTTVQGDIHWSKTSVTALNETVALGNLSAKLSCEQGALTAIIDEKNDLGISFTAYVRPKRISGNGYLTPTKNFPEKLYNVLPFLGKSDNQGRYRLGF